MQSNEDGYSLMETMIAFAVMALVLSALLPGQSKLLSRTVSAEERIMATEYAYSYLDTLGVSEPILNGQNEHQYRNWSIFYTTLPASSDTALDQFTQLNLTVKNKQGVILTNISRLVLLDEK